MAEPWRNCNASMTLLNAVNDTWPLRDKASDGSIGDAEHATRDSDHNPWLKVNGIGVVRARDIDVDGINAAWLAEQLRILGYQGDRRLRNGGYLILNGKISKQDFSGWSVYTGVNRHDTHLHVSFSLDQAGFDSTAPWDFLEGDDFLSGLPENQQKQIYVAIGNCWAVSQSLGTPVDLGTAVAWLYHWLKVQPDAAGTAWGTLSNALVSVANQTFAGSDDYGPSVLARLDELAEKVDALASPPTGQ